MHTAAPPAELMAPLWSAVVALILALAAYVKAAAAHRIGRKNAAAIAEIDCPYRTATGECTVAVPTPEGVALANARPTK